MIRKIYSSDLLGDLASGGHIVTRGQGWAPDIRSDGGNQAHTPDPELSQGRLLAGSKWRLKAGSGSITDPNVGVSQEEASDQVRKEWLDGPFQFDEEGWLVTADGPQVANPALRFGV